MTKKRIEALKYFAGLMTAVVAFVVFDILMILYTQKDYLEIFVLYVMFIEGPAFAVPFLIAGEEPDDAENDN